MLDSLLGSIDYLNSYLPLIVLIAFSIAFAGGMLVANFICGPHRSRKVKNDTYESGVPAVGDARGRVHIRFYVIAVLFLLFDVEVILLWPFAKVFYNTAVEKQILTWNGIELGMPFMIVGIGIFFLLLIIGFLYEWRKGVFQWD